jgi:hypothetical protein
MPYNPQDYNTPLAMAMGGTAPGVAPINAGDDDPQAPQQDFNPQAPQMYVPQIQQAQQQKSWYDNANKNGLWNGMGAAGAALLGGTNFNKSLGQAVEGFNGAYDASVDKDRELNQPKVIPMADGAFTLLAYPNGSQKVVRNSEVADHLAGIKKQDAINKRDTILFTANANAEANNKKAAEKASLDNAGDAAATAASAKELRTVADEVEKSQKDWVPASGGIIGAIPQSVRAVVSPENAALQDRAYAVIQNQLKATLGNQYTENEGKQLLARSFDPHQTPTENARRLRSLADNMDAMQADKSGAQAYMAKHGTLQGYTPGAASATPAASPQAPAQGGVQDNSAVAAEMRRRGLLK